MKLSKSLSGLRSVNPVVLFVNHFPWCPVSVRTGGSSTSLTAPRDFYFQGKGGTIDEEIKWAKAMVNKAFDNDIVGGDTLKTFKRIKKMLRKNANRRTRILSLDEYDRLIEHLPAYLKPIIATGFYTGMRRSEILSLTWEKVDLKARVIHLEATDTKDQEARDIPICDELYAVLRLIPRNIHDSHVFLYAGRSIKSIRKGLLSACEKADIVYGRFEKNGFIFHDLRHTFNTNMRKAGVPESVIMEITGHSTRDMFDRYNKIDGKGTRKAVDQLQTYLKLQSVDRNVDQKAMEGM